MIINHSPPGAHPIDTVFHLLTWLAIPLEGTTSSARRSHHKGYRYQHGKPSIDSRKYPHRCIIEKDRVDQSSNKGNQFIGRKDTIAEFELEHCQWAIDSEQGNQSNYNHSTKVYDPKPEVSYPAPSENDPQHNEHKSHKNEQYVAQVDSSVGGKTAINHPKGKNLIGSFHQPSLVVSDPDILSTLPTEDLRSGLGEVIKHGVIADAALFKFIEDKAISLMRRDPHALSLVIKRSVEIKGRLVSVDERDDKGIRAILNYGHTVGHALEILSSNMLRHGEAVAQGMIFASLLSHSLNLISTRDIERQRLLLKELEFDMNPPALSSTKIIEIMHRDKKVEDESIRFVLPTGIGSPPVLRPVSESLIIRTLEDEGFG